MTSVVRLPSGVPGKRRKDQARRHIDPGDRRVDDGDAGERAGVGVGTTAPRLRLLSTLQRRIAQRAGVGVEQFGHAGQFEDDRGVERDTHNEEQHPKASEVFTRNNAFNETDRLKP